MLAGDVFDFLEIPAGSAFDVSPEQAIAYFKGKGLKPTFSYAEMLNEAHAQAFTVAKMMDVDMLGQLKDSLDSAMAVGQSFQEWRDQITPILQAGGWWGRKKVVDPVSGKEVVAQLGSPSRLETIFRTNMQSAYAAGQWQQIQDTKKAAPLLMYDAVDDFRTRPQHAAWDRRTLRIDNPWWQQHYPPNGWNCRCGVIQLTEKEAADLGLAVLETAPVEGTYVWVNPRTGEKVDVPEGIDPGFGSNQGATYLAQLKKLLAEKVKAKKIAAGQALAQAMAKQQELVNQVAETGAKASEVARANAIAAQQRANQTADAALAAAKKRADEQLALQAAKDELAAIAGGKSTSKIKVHLEKAYAVLDAAGKLEQLGPHEALAAVQELGQQLKAAKDLSSKLSVYKAAVLAGKIPQAATVKALESMPEADKAAFLAKVTKEKAALDAKKAALQAAEAEKAAKAAAAAPEAPAGPAKASEPVKMLVAAADQAPDPAKLVQIGQKTKGSNPGGLFQDTETGTKWLLKFPDSLDNARNEALAGRLYQLAGVDAPELHVITYKGKPAIASRIVEGIREVKAAELAKTPAVLEGFGVDAWLANWDSIGLDYDNTVLKAGGAIRIDVGGSLRYRAMGGLKGDAFGDLVEEIDSLRDARTARQAAAVFKGMTDAQLERAVAKVVNLQDQDILALVEQFGPEDAATRRELGRKLLARKAYLAQRFPGALARPAAPAAIPEPAAFVSQTELRAIANSGRNGFTIRTDGGDIEDQAVLVNHFTAADGTPRTRLWLKIRPAAMQRLQRQLADVASAGASPSVSMRDWREKVLITVKGMNTRAAAGQNFDAKDVTRLQEAIKAGAALRETLLTAIVKAKDPAALKKQLELLDEWDTKLRGLSGVSPTLKAVKVDGQFPVAQIPDAVEYSIPETAPKAQGIPWKRGDRMAVDQLDEQAKQTGATSVRTEAFGATLEDGTRVRFVPEGGQQALKGLVWIDTKGADAAAVQRAVDVLRDMEIATNRATEIDRKNAYLNAFAALRLSNNRAALREVLALDQALTGNELITAKLAKLKSLTSTDIAASEGWRQFDGVDQALNSGRLTLRRPDLDGPDFDALERSHRVFHNPNGLGIDGNGAVASHVERILQSGGAAASQVDRMRRGVYNGDGSSVSADISSGGADYLFTRIKTTTRKQGPGFYWKARVLRRMDAITYPGDHFGNTTESSLQAYRGGHTVDSFRKFATSSSNETIFKGGLHFFEDLDRIVCNSTSDRAATIAAFRRAGYTRWPDGRSLEEVIVV